MLTKFNVDGEVWYFNPNTEVVEKAKVVTITIEKDGSGREVEYYTLDNRLILPGMLLFSAKIQCVAHYQKIFAD